MRRFRAALFFFLVLWLLTAVCSADASQSARDIAANENRATAGRLEHGVLTLHLELQRGVWHPEAADGSGIEAYSFAQEGLPPQTPGPMIRVPQGNEVRVSVRNFLPVTVFVHGLHQHPGKMDDAMELIPGQTKEAQFSAGEPGSYLYWASTIKEDIENRPFDEGLMSGAFIVDAPQTSVSDRVFVIQVWSKDLFHPTFRGALSINGKSWPYTERLHAQLGQPEHWRILNASRLVHPMHLHGFYFHVDATGDSESAHQYSEAERRMAVTELVRAGNTFDMTWVPERAGNWVFHCHILDHMMADYKAPWLYGPDGPPPSAKHVHGKDDLSSMGMGELVMGISVTDNKPQFIPAKALVPATERHLFVRQRAATPYAPAGPGFYLQGVSKTVGASGPPLVVTRGERTAITVHNELDEPTAIHWHGIEIESYYDGVPGWNGTAQRTTPFIPAGESFVAYMTPPRAGTFIYHTHWHDVKQLTGGMYGALLVMEPGRNYDPTTDKVFVLGRGGLNEMQDPLLLNGSPQPGLMVLLTGQTYRFRLVNITPNDRLVATSLLLNNRPVQWRAVAKDGADLPVQQATMRDSVQTISVGETYDFEFSPDAPGAYELRFCSDLGSEVTQMIAVVPPKSPFSAFVAKR